MSTPARFNQYQLLDFEEHESGKKGIEMHTFAIGRNPEAQIERSEHAGIAQRRQYPCYIVC